AIQRAKEKGEIRQDVNVEETASVFWQVFFGFSFEQSFFQGVNIKQLEQKLHSIYSLLKA
ncbi:MAG TPA: TetR family transcriptional regulator, partial [Bacteroides uniformis]|nr:TetR family transcriptional regulator [Bacteroides uniformis]